MSRVIASKYELGRVLGRGGMGEVYEATDTTNGREVAVKVMRLSPGADTASGGSEETEREWEVRFEREVQAIESLRSPHVVAVLDAGIDPDSNDHYLVMERLTGEDLSSLHKRLGPLPPELVLRLVAQSLLGLEAAHASGIVHRDIKPGNLFLTHDGAQRTVRILDFGIARIGSSDDGSDDLTELTRTGSMLGSPQYMAPEQVRGAKRVDARADIWSMGVVMYRLLTGRTPHKSEDGVGGLLIAICTMPAPPIQPRAPWVSAEIARVVRRALALKKEDRYASARAMYEAIVALIPGGNIELDDSKLVGLTDADRGLVADPLETTEVIGAATEAMPPSDRFITDSHAAVAQTHPQPPPAPRSRLPIFLAAAALVIAGVGVTFAVVPRRTATATAPPASTAAPIELITANVRISGADSVEVDGVQATPANGVVVLRGKPGSMHMVKVGSGVNTPVLLTETGAVPSSIEVPASLVPPAASASTQKVSAPKPSPKPTPAKSSAPATNPGIRTSFE